MRIEPKFFLQEDIPKVITCFKFGDNRFRGLASAEGQILPFPIDFDGRPYNTLTLPCERVICLSNKIGYNSAYMSDKCKKTYQFKTHCKDDVMISLH